MIGAKTICVGSMSSPTLSALMIHEIDLTVKIWPGYGRDEEPAERTVLFNIETTRTPLPSALTVDKRCSAVLRGGSHEDRLIGGGARDRNRMVTQGVETAI